MAAEKLRKTRAEAKSVAMKADKLTAQAGQQDRMQKVSCSLAEGSAQPRHFLKAKAAASKIQAS